MPYKGLVKSLVDGINNYWHGCHSSFNFLVKTWSTSKLSWLFRFDFFKKNVYLFLIPIYYIPIHIYNPILLYDWFFIGRVFVLYLLNFLLVILKYINMHNAVTVEKRLLWPGSLVINMSITTLFYNSNLMWFA